MSFEEVCKRAETDTQYDYKVDRKQVALAEEGSCVLGSRLAIWLLDTANLTVYLEAPVEVRAKRIQQREGGLIETVLINTRERDARDRDRYRKLYSIDIDAYGFADLTIDTVNYNAHQIAEIIIQNVEQRGGNSD